MKLQPQSLSVYQLDSELAHLLINDSLKISLKLIDNYTSNYEFHLIKKIDGLGYVDMTEIVSGKIPIFEFSKSTYDPNFGGGLSNNVYQFYIFENQLKELNIQNLKNDLTDEPSQRIIRKIRRKSITKVVAFTIGSGFMAYGLSEMMTKPDPSQPSEFKFSPNPPFLAGLLIIASPFMFGSAKSTLIDVVKNYNSINPTLSS